jgi:hypothetical protein
VIWVGCARPGGEACAARPSVRCQREKERERPLANQAQRTVCGRAATHAAAAARPSSMSMVVACALGGGAGLLRLRAGAARSCLVLREESARLPAAPAAAAKGGAARALGARDAHPARAGAPLRARITPCDEQGRVRACGADGRFVWMGRKKGVGGWVFLALSLSLALSLCSGDGAVSLVMGLWLLFAKVCEGEERGAGGGEDVLTRGGRERPRRHFVRRPQRSTCLNGRDDAAPTPHSTHTST